MKWLVLGDIGRRSIYHVGDEAMADAAIEALSFRRATSITLIATDADVATELYGLSAVQRVGVGPRWSTAERAAMLEQADSGDIDPTSRLGLLDAAVANADAVLISGGGNMTSRFGHHIDERAALARLARRRGVPLVVAAQTVGPALTARERGLVAEILGYARAFAVRDDESHRLALDLGGDPARVHRMSDDAVLLEPRAADLDAAAEYASPGSGYAIASFTSDPGRSGLDRHEYLDRIAGILDDVAHSLDIDVLLVPHIGALEGAIKRGDELSDASLVERSSSGRIRALPPMTARVCAALTRGALLSVSTRYHPVVFGPAQGTPAIGISLSRYSTVRMRGALEPLGLGPFVLGPGSWEEVPAAARELADRRHEVQAWFEPLLEARRARQQRWWDAATRLTERVDLPRAVPEQAAQFPASASWAGPASRALTLFDELDLERERVTEMQGSLDAARGEAKASAARVKSLRDRVQAATRRAERAENRRVVRLVDRLGEVARGRAVRRPREDGPAERPVPGPLLSVLIPIFNVEEYLQECLESVVEQSLTDLEILLIDDGSTDSSAAIAQAFADGDRRVRLIRQENQGLGAVRNRGVQLARGRYLTFVDSDDIVPRQGFAALVDTLEESGSDLSIGGTVRLQPDGSHRTWQWVRDLHASDQRTTLAKTPRLLRDFYTWNKVYRREFWQRHGFRFREGVLFEDQPVITEILCRAASIDVIAQTAYHYRLRPDDSALTGRMYSLADIRTRDEAHRLTAGVLEDLDVDSSIRDAWLWTLAEHHLPRYLENTAAGGSAEYEAVVEMTRAVLSVDDLRRLEGVSAAHRLLCHLALTQPQATVARYLDAGGSSTSNLEITSRAGHTWAVLPVDAAVGAQIPEELHLVSPDEQRLVAILDRHEWSETGVLSLTARVGVAQTPEPREVRVEAALALAGGVRVPLALSGRLVPTAEVPRPFGVAAWYETTIALDAGALEAEHADELARGARIEIDVAWDGIERTGVLGRRSEALAASGLSGSVIPGTERVLEVAWSRADGLRVRTPQRDVRGTVSIETPGHLEVRLRSRRPEFDVVFVTIKAAGAPERRHLVQRIARGEYRVVVDASWLEPGGVAYLTAIDEAGTRRNLHVPALERGEGGDEGLVLDTTPGARLRVTRPLRQDASPSAGSAA